MKYNKISFAYCRNIKRINMQMNESIAGAKIEMSGETNSTFFFFFFSCICCFGIVLSGFFGFI